MSRTIAVVGLGYVGLPLALLAVGKGYEVRGIDNDQAKIDLINRGVAPFPDQAISRQLKRQPIKASSDYGKVENAGITLVCVPTPVTETYMPDLATLSAVCRQLGQHLKPGQLVIIESTVNPGVCEEVVIPILEDVSSLRCGRDFYLAHCPERINPGDDQWDVSNISRVVGANDPVSLKRAVSFYKSLISGEVKPMASLKEAEAVKVVENSFRDINIAFVNELAMSFTRLGIDIVNVIDGASTKPFSFMPHYPGAGVGGHCIPVDPYYLIEYAKKNGFEHRFLSLARTINNSMPQFTVEQLETALRELRRSIAGLRVTVLGLSYKANVGDLRESPSLKIIEELERRSAKVSAYDPYIDRLPGVAMLPAKKPAGRSAKSKQDWTERLKGTEAIVIATNHDRFKALSPARLKQLGVKVVIDGRNCLDKDAFAGQGIIYKGIGR